MKVLIFLLSLLSFFGAIAQEKVGVTPVITVDADRNYGLGHAGKNAEYIQQLRNAVLPVTLLNFDLKILNNTVSIEWKTTSEKNNSHFILKRSGGDKEFTELSRIEAKGRESSSVNLYQYTDRYPLTGYNYYQLEQVDADGTKILSDIISVNYSLKEQDVYAYFSEQGYLNAVFNLADLNTPVDIAITNLNGQIIMQKRLTSLNVNRFEFNDVYLNKGLYVISFSFKNHIISQKIIK